MQRRLVFVSRYRGFLGALVVLIHAGITYGAAGAWYYVQPAGDPWLRTLASFLSFAARSFVPGAFFFLSGYFVPGSLEHRGTWGLLRERCMRLLIPLAVYALVANPLLVRVVAFRGSGGSVRSGLIFGPGPAWFLAALFVFLLVFLGARWAFPGRPAATARGIPSQPRILMSIVVFAFLSFLLRSLFPADDGISRLPMYAILFAAGIKAGTEQWLEDIASLPIGAWSVLAGGGLLLFPVLGM
ncbi:MAG TPA: acyltransferase family protein, partial [Spirochaetia bacterium]|nr:acyltransferase family protein [Spirochaetia bacterium]